MIYATRLFVFFRGVVLWLSIANDIHVHCSYLQFVFGGKNQSEKTRSRSVRLLQYNSLRSEISIVRTAITPEVIVSEMSYPVLHVYM